jgi:cytochrome o ubiquinol oxidase subunit III
MSDNINNPTYSNDPAFIKIASKKVFGFWIYLMSDCILFATLFTTFAIFSSSNTGSQPGSSIFNLHNTLIETFCLLSSSFTFGLAIFAMNQDNKRLLITWLSATFILGLSFVGLEINEFYHLILGGNGPDKSAFLSSFFSLVGTHGLHVSFGLIWIGLMIVEVLKKDLILATKTRLILLSLFWHFLDIIWICIFTFVYLMGSLK